MRHFCLFDFWVWVFNVADAAVCVGAALFALDLILETVKEYKKSHNGSEKTQNNGEEENNG
jgi:lipoprotein signal peptidase